jgi:hypothetical protein
MIAHGAEKIVNSGDEYVFRLVEGVLAEHLFIAA